MTYTKWFALWCFVFMLVACGDDSGSSVNTDPAEEPVDDEGDLSSSGGKAKSSSSNKSSSSAKENSSSSFKFEVRNKTFYGFAQKGPFYEESVVNIYELDEKTLAKTEEVFSEKVVVGSTGKFKVPHVNLSSPYALFEVSGRFRNEVTAAKSKKSITLYALVDISDRKDVNINVFTHTPVLILPALFLVLASHIIDGSVSVKPECRPPCHK